MTEPTLYQLACGLLELRDRIAALEAAGGVAGNSGHASESPAGVTVDCLPPGLSAVWVGTPADVAPRVVPIAPAVLTVDELACIMREMPDTDYRGEAAWLLNHPRIGPLLRGEGAPAPVRVVLAEEPPFWRMPYVEGPGSADALARAVWAAARAEVERQQQGGQADG